ncbi:asparaginase, partial [candidate division KSB1 bacterium]
MDHMVIRIMRNGLIESLHEGFIAVVDTEGRPAAGLGNIHYQTFFRSSAKPFQLYPLMLKNGVDRFGFTTEEIAVMCSSHTGQPDHVACVLSVLDKTGFNPGNLKCGIHPPLYAPEAERILREGKEYGTVHNNCSGKHAGMLAQTLLYG